MSTLGEITWINKNIDDSPLETIKLLFKLIFGEPGRVNRKKLKSFTGFHLDYQNMEMKIAKVTKDFCICKLKTISHLLSLEQLDTGKEMAESICIFLNDVNKLHQLEREKSQIEIRVDSDNKSTQQAAMSFQDDQETITATNLNMKAGFQAAGTSNQEFWRTIQLQCTQLTNISRDSRNSGDSLIPAFTINIKLETLGRTVEAILDSGSPISFLSYGVLPKTIKFESYDNRFQFRGITGSKINIIGRYKQTVVTQECEKLVTFYVIPNGILSSSCLLGRDYISQILLTLDGGISNISNKTD